MSRLEKRAWRSLYWAAYWRDMGDSEGERAAMARWRGIAAKIQERMDAAFTPHIEIGGLA